MESPCRVHMAHILRMCVSSERRLHKALISSEPGAGPSAGPALRVELTWDVITFRFSHQLRGQMCSPSRSPSDLYSSDRSPSLTVFIWRMLSAAYRINPAQEGPKWKKELKDEAKQKAKAQEAAQIIQHHAALGTISGTQACFVIVLRMSAATTMSSLFWFKQANSYQTLSHRLSNTIVMFLSDL